MTASTDRAGQGGRCAVDHLTPCGTIAGTLQPRDLLNLPDRLTIDADARAAACGLPSMPARAGAQRARLHGLRFLTLHAVLCLLTIDALAAQRTSPRETLYRCKDASGQTHYGDSLPEGCAGRDTEVLSENGTVLRVIESESSRQARARREAQEDNQRRQREQQRQNDQVLLATYLSVQDIERLRDQRLELLTAQARLTEQNIATAHQRSRRLETQVSRYRPYNDRSDAPPVPDHLAEEMVNLVNNLQVYQQALRKNQQEQAQLRARFDADIQRFKELKGLR